MQTPLIWWRHWFSSTHSYTLRSKSRHFCFPVKKFLFWHFHFRITKLNEFLEWFSVLRILINEEIEICLYVMSVCYFWGIIYSFHGWYWIVFQFKYCLRFLCVCQTWNQRWFRDLVAFNFFIDNFKWFVVVWCVRYVMNKSNMDHISHYHLNFDSFSNLILSMLPPKVILAHSE